MSKVHSISVTGYKSIRSLQSFKLNNLNVLIGGNGAGKSNFIGLFKLLNQIYEQDLQVYSQVQGGPDALLHFGRAVTTELRAAFVFGDDPSLMYYDFRLKPTVDNRFVFSQELIVEVLPTDDTAGELYQSRGDVESKFKDKKGQQYSKLSSSVESLRVYHFQDTSDTAKVKRPCATNVNIRLLPDAENLVAYLRMLSEKHEVEYRRIVDTIRLALPFFGDFFHRPGAPEYVELEWTQKGKPDMPFKAHMLSDGSLRFICLVTLLLQPIELLPDTILIDEPELGLHPYAITLLASIFRQVAEKKQLILATQSVELINELSAEDIIVVDHEDGASTFKRFSQDELSGWLTEYAMGELWQRNILGGRP